MKKQTKAFHEFDICEEAIVEHLVDDFGYFHDAAVQLVNYYAPIRQLIGDYPTMHDYARMYHEANTEKVSVEEWEKTILDIRREVKMGQIRERLANKKIKRAFVIR
ncbi:hypothetical protein [Paenibacillus alkalitolerans]|uniref:hypothetical protein n=1 Tax=Paenibacillus alkalitolerans TaxID=2799335 RepID=UPI0018F41286|nr:hypothetical protein [Paenibacillus alkalitolerans]